MPEIIKADFHIHSCLSPCGSLEMSPRAIVKRAKEQGLNLIALTDHNTARNCPTFKNICAEEKIHCLFGLEVNTLEEVHTLCLFDDLDQALALDEYIYQNLPAIENIPEKLGDQVIVNENNEIVDVVKKYLGTATYLSIDTIAEKVLDNGGLFIPAHVNRGMFSLTSQLGFIPENENFSALEIYKTTFLKNTPPLPNTHNYPLISNSDAHYLEAIGTIWNEFELEEISIKNIAKILKENKHKINYQKKLTGF